MRILPIILTCLLLGCERKPSLVVNAAARDIAAAFADGTLHEIKIEDKEAFLSGLGDWIEKMFVVGGYDHRLDECKQNWKLFEDRGHLFFSVPWQNLTKTHIFSYGSLRRTKAT